MTTTEDRPLRMSGRTPGTEVAEDEAQELTEPMAEAVVPEERRLTFERLSFARMQTEWRGEDAAMMQQIHAVVDGRLFEEFVGAYRIMHELYELVRDPEVDEATGEVRTDQFGMTVWQTDAVGGYIEDWTRLTYAERDNFLFKITTSMWDWRAQRDRIWGESMFAKGLWTEQFARAYDEAPGDRGRGTIEGRTARANIEASERRYFALFVGYLSRRADSICYVMERLAQSLKDTLPK